MNFAELENSKFFKMGHYRVDNIDTESQGIRNIKLAPIASYDVMDIDVDNKILKAGIEDSNTLVSIRYMNIVNLGQALRSGDEYIPKEFRSMIYQQWIEMNSIFYRLGAQPKLVKLLIQRPGTSPGPHAHWAKQTLTFAHFYEENKVDSLKGSYFTLNSGDTEYEVSIPEKESRLYFKFPNGQCHNVWSHRWAFYWYADYDQDIIIPNDVNFTYLDLSNNECLIKHL